MKQISLIVALVPIGIWNQFLSVQSFSFSRNVQRSSMSAPFLSLEYSQIRHHHSQHRTKTLLWEQPNGKDTTNGYAQYDWPSKVSTVPTTSITRPSTSITTSSSSTTAIPAEFSPPIQVLLSLPAAMAFLAFWLYKDTSEAFHALVDVASHHTWAPVDGGAYLTDLITPALQGPVTNVISILFGTLVSMTIGNLYQRQATMSRTLADMLDAIRLAELHAEWFPPHHRQQAEDLLDSFSYAVFAQAEQGVMAPETLRERLELGQFVTLLHTMSREEQKQQQQQQQQQLKPLSSPSYDPVPGPVLVEAYNTINRIIQLRCNLISTYEMRLPIWHYGNLTILALAICTTFLVLTDKTALQFLGGFQLRLCWSMLVGTFAMLAVVIYDLNTPLSGVFQVGTTAEPKTNDNEEEEDVCVFM